MTTQGTTRFITDTSFARLLDIRAGSGPVYIPRAAEQYTGGLGYHYTRYSYGMSYSFTGFRPAEPLKNFFFPRREPVASYPENAMQESAGHAGPFTVVGCAACDVVSLKSLDAVFLQDDWTDTFYRDRREQAFLIAADCTEPRESCLCTKSGINPYPEAGFDLSLSPVEQHFLVTAGSEAGERFMAEHADLFEDPAPALIDLRDRTRATTVDRVNEINAGYNLSKSRRELLAIQRESDDWHTHVAPCIECGACLFACPTCHCFLLSDHISPNGSFSRVKSWDACSYAGYSRMAGGSSPRLGLMERFRHRYLHKFEYYPDNFGFEACTGCGRCIEGCMGRIDMRRVFTALDKLPSEVRP